jgi:hypothetical protein
MARITPAGIISSLLSTSLEPGGTLKLMLPVSLVVTVWHPVMLNHGHNKQANNDFPSLANPSITAMGR